MNLSDHKYIKDNKGIVVVLRHGEREDDVNLLNLDKAVYINEDDPMLTDKGMLQARSIGEQIYEVLLEFISKDGNIDENIDENIENIENKRINLEINIHTSPFTRTTMTSNSLIEGIIDKLKSHKSESNLNTNTNMNKDTDMDKNPIKNYTFNPKINYTINYGLYEYLNPKVFKHHPDEFLEINSKNSTKIMHTYTDNDTDKNITIDKSDMPLYPEELPKMISRYQEAIKKIITSNSSFNTNTNTYNLTLLITHGYGVQIISEYLNYPEDFMIVEYCSSFIFTYQRIDPNNNTNTNSISTNYIKSINPIIY